MTKNIIIKPFVTPFIADFIVVLDQLPFKEEDIHLLDKELLEYEQVYLDPDVEKNLISKNELLASFGISKAERSTLTLQEAQDVYDVVMSDSDYNFIKQKLKNGKKLTRKDYDKLEFFNIAKAFRKLNGQSFSLHELTPELIKNIHAEVTKGMDVFKDYLVDFTPYRSGRWRDNDLIRVGDYVPMPHIEIESGVNELISWLKKNQTVNGVAIFHTALYAIHPFNNGNKRVCRVIEHVLLREIGLNAKNLYSTSYYYHKEKARYYKNLLASLERKNLNHFVSFVLEACVLSAISVIKTSLETKRSEFLARQELDDSARSILKPLIKRRELQFKHLYSKTVQKKMARQTFVNYLEKAVSADSVIRRESGRSTFYRLNLTTPAEELFNKWLAFASARLPYIPDEIRLS